MALTYGFALNSQDTSAQFSEAFYALVGDGVCEYGGRFAIMLNGGFNATLSTGFALANGRYLESDEPYTFTFSPSGNYSDRYDAVAVRVDYVARKALIDVLVDINPSAITANPSLIRNDTGYSIILYIVHIKRGATVLHNTDITDTRGNPVFCGYVSKIDSIAEDVLYTYKFLQSGIDDEVDRIIGLSEALVNKADAAIADFDSAIAQKGRTSVGDLLESKLEPTPSLAWLMCDGGGIPVAYPDLSNMLNGVLPNNLPTDARFSMYIYGGLPVSGYPKYMFYVQDGNLILRSYGETPDYSIIDGDLVLAYSGNAPTLFIDETDGCLYMRIE